MTDEELLQKISSLPVESRRKVEQYISRLKRIHIPIEDEPTFGMWRDREDMKNPTAWVRKIRGE